MHDRLGIAWRFGLLLFAVLVMQVAVMADLVAFGQVGDLLLLLAIVAGLVGGPDRGATLGFVAGFSYDLLVVDVPFGLSALVYALVGYGVGSLGGWMAQPRRWFVITTAVVATVVGVVLTALISRVLGRDLPLDEVIRMAAVEAVWSAALILPARRLLRWALGDDRSDSYRIALP
jgi:rod shape-determining protein MreD